MPVRGFYRRKKDAPPTSPGRHAGRPPKKTPTPDPVILRFPNVYTWDCPGCSRQNLHAVSPAQMLHFVVCRHCGAQYQAEVTP